MKEALGYDLPTIVGTKLKELRKEKRFTLEELGQMLEPPADKSVVSNWEHGKNLPNKKRLDQLSIIYNVSLGFFYSNDQIVEMLGNENKSLKNKIAVLREENEALKTANIFLSSKLMNIQDELNR